MALASSGVLKFKTDAGDPTRSIQSEFSAGSNSLRAYVRGGSYVPDGPAGNADIPVAPGDDLRMTDFYDAVSLVHTLSGQTINTFGSGTVYAGIRVNSDGTVDARGPNSSSFSQIDSATDWVIPNGLNSEYVRADIISGPSFEGTSDSTGTWLALSSNRLWYTTDSGGGKSATTFRIRIATDSGGTNVVADSNDTTDYVINPTFDS